MSNVTAARTPHASLSSKTTRFINLAGWTVLGVGTASFSMALAVGIDLHLLADSMQLVVLCLALAGPAAGAAILLIMKSIDLPKPDNHAVAYYVLVGVRIIASLAAAAFIMAATVTVFYLVMVALIA